MLSQAENTFKNAVRNSLAALDQQIEEALAALISHEYPPEVYAIAFEVFPDSFTSGFPARAFFMDRTNTEFFLYSNGKAEYPSPIDPQLLELVQIYPTELEERFEDDASDHDPWELATDEFICWFSARWSSAGGNSFRRVATISAHDSNREFNLISKQWQPSYAAFDR